MHDDRPDDQRPEYGGIAREDRIDSGGDGPWCDKAWHLSGGGPKAPAAVVLTCAMCGRVYARCAACNAGRGRCALSMAGHIASHHPKQRSRSDRFFNP